MNKDITSYTQYDYLRVHWGVKKIYVHLGRNRFVRVSHSELTRMLRSVEINGERFEATVVIDTDKRLLFFTMK